MFFMLGCYFFFFFKQKTAYEMRISDWSSDVCSSDLRPTPIMSNSRTREEGRHIVSNLSPGDEFAQIMIQRIIASGDCESTPCRPYRMLAKGRKIGRASGRERVCQYVSISVVDVSFKKKEKKQKR